MGSEAYWLLEWKSRVMSGVTCMYLLGFVLHFRVISAQTDPTDVAALKGLASEFQNAPSNWSVGDPCDDSWIGIRCNNSRVTSIHLSSLGLVGTLSGDIQSLTELRILDLSYNKGLTGNLPPSIRSLTKLVNLILAGCSFSGEIPMEIGSLQSLIFLSLNFNRFTGSIPATIGNLRKLYWLDLADNRLTGTIPVSDGTNPGLDMLTHTWHFHFGMNQLSGTIPSKLFSSNMKLIHLLFDNNNLSGSLPPTLGLVQSLEAVRLDRNSFTGSVPSNINNLTNTIELHLENNKFVGPLPNLTGMNALSYVDLSNNLFDASGIPQWFSTLPSLTTMYLEYLGIEGEIPSNLFSSSPLQTLKLRNNSFNGTLDIGTDFSPQLDLVDLQYNKIAAVTVGGGYNKQLILTGNPICNQDGANIAYCTLSQNPAPPPYSTPLNNCLPVPCPTDQSLSTNCKCAVPYSGTLRFRAPTFSDLTNTSYYHILEVDLLNKLHKYEVPVDSVSLHDPFTTQWNYLQISLAIFPTGKVEFDQSDISNLGFVLSNQTYKPPAIFGPYYFLAQEYHFSQGARGTSSTNLPVIIGPSIAAAVVCLLLIGFAIFVIRRKKKTSKMQQKSQSFGSWGLSNTSASSPQLKGARWFSFDELRKCTNNFSEANIVGSGGYGKVYRGSLSNGQLLAIKRADQGSMQGGLEFKTEIEMLSRVHHRNLVALIGFCFDQGEQMLVYEYVPNGSLKESLSGKSGVHLDWKRRLRVAINAASGLAYLHEFADPPIVHRDIKPSNILLDDNLNAKVSDFGLCKPMGQQDRNGYVTTQVKGTMGYLDPEYYMTQQLTIKSDVYSFGIVMLELITARKPIERGRYIVREVRTAMDPTEDFYGLHQLLDPALEIGTGLPGFQKYVDLAMRCVEESALCRPSMTEVVKELQSIMQFAGVKVNAESSRSASVSGAETSSGQSQHPYDKESLFEYSGGLPSGKIEPK